MSNDFEKEINRKINTIIRETPNEKKKLFMEMLINIVIVGILSKGNKEIKEDISVTTKHTDKGKEVTYSITFVE